MPAPRRLATSFLTVCCLFLTFVCSAGAQCGLAQPGFGGIGAVPGIPFQAERVATMMTPADGSAAAPQLPAALVARDSQGRVRFETTGAEYQVKTGPEAGTEVEQHSVIICDPANHTVTRLDTLNKTAVIKQVKAVPPSPSFCEAWRRALSRWAEEDLGYQTIEGLDTRGARIRYSIDTPNGASSGQYVQDWWCSDELAAMVLEDATTPKGGKSSFALTNLTRREPDPALFQIPSDFTVIEERTQPSGAGAR